MTALTRRSVDMLRAGLRHALQNVPARSRMANSVAPYPPDFDPELIALLERVRPYSVTSVERLASVVSATEHVVRSQLRGAIVECGVWKGGSMMAAACTLLRLGLDDRDLYLFDTFTGMSEPSACDIETAAANGVPARASETWREINEWCAVGLEEVRANLLSTGYPASRLHFVEGNVEDTIPGVAPQEIALLRLDTDWYESTSHELSHLYPRLSRGGILLIDDYGHWSGARRAVDEYFGTRLPFLHRIDYTGRLALKP